MFVSFFEEYPTKDNLSKLKLIPFQTNIYIACRNVKEFLKLKTEIKKEYNNVNKIVYWPILDLSEGYWISAFSKTKAIKRILSELRDTKENFPVLWDAEVPTLNKILFLTELLHLSANRKLIREAIRDEIKNHPLIVAELPRYGVSRLLADFAAVSFPFSNYHRLDMLYSSLLKTQNKEEYIRHVIKDSKERFIKYSVGLGLIGRGEEDRTTPLASIGELDRDLNIAKEEGVREAVIYRLGGLNIEYLRILKRYTV